MRASSRGSGRWTWDAGKVIGLAELELWETTGGKHCLYNIALGGFCLFAFQRWEWRSSMGYFLTHVELKCP